ncbi:DUF6795 domain-containing protein [Limnobacter sp.]|uniref:DUF6795 domain-containing protein n=1 Tax=Limnobacter sp. TaxID=2003368 RepID=UPI0027B9B153|nr:DUF6795 domain-containing protein [Limnobacter sp.]
MFRKIVYCSPIEGFIHWQGKPLGNLKVTRLLRSGGFENDEYQDEVQTDSEGRFQFQMVAERRFLRPDLLSANPHVSQVLEVYFDGQPHTFWAFQKQNFELGTEAKGGVLNIECDLSKYEQNSYGRIVRCKHNGVQQYE